jgi:hypothetical protein
MAEFANNTTMAADNSASSIDASSKKGAKKGKVANTSKLVNAIEDEQVDELYEMDDWGKLNGAQAVYAQKFDRRKIFLVCRELMEDL